MEKFDFVVAGAGTGGCIAAKTAAEAGLKTCLIDVKDTVDIGKKICGDAIGRHHFDSLGLKEPTAEEIERVMEGIKIYSPDKQTSYVVKGEKLYGYILNRYRFGQRLLGEAVDAGAVLYDKTQVLEPIIEGGFVCGVVAKDLRDAKKKTLRSSLIVEATGFSAAIRKKLKPETGIDLHVDNEDVEACYREIRQLRHPLNEPDLCQIYLTQAISPGGYYWIFPEGGNKVNVGLGVAMTDKFPNPKEQLYKYVLSQPLFEGSSIVDKGAWFVPTRRPLDSMVGNGVIIVGDAACQVNPIHGGGMGPSMIGGMLAGKTATNALEKGNTNREALWGYNIDYIRSYGAKQAGLEIFRILLQNMDDEDLDYGMRYRLLTEEDVLKASLGEDTHFTVTEKAKRAFRGIKKLSVLKKLKDATNSMREIKAWYRNYPKSPKDFDEWKATAEEIIKEATIQFKQ
ncbi:MAG: geranylgeranyl reductase family protein [Candidatus Bathyarchaeia archaeon]